MLPELLGYSDSLHLLVFLCVPICILTVGDEIKD